jgi:hypothetical protein
MTSPKDSEHDPFARNGAQKSDRGELALFGSQTSKPAEPPIRRALTFEESS